ncbi:MAG TPA: LuxR C-terminal-related transcriptional regulator [Saprospiraceae bacterium]|nr:LuxR C-terminal-related transcriptional regulator [Saprospiraceae bacterium]
MNKNAEDLHSVVSYWKKAHQVNTNNRLKTNQVHDLVESFFNTGKHYYYILNFFDLRFEYVHPTVEEFIGCKPEAYKFALEFEKMHPLDATKIKFKENAANEFYYNRIPSEKIFFYKSTYTFRLSDGKGGWKNILHQSIPLQVTEFGRIQYILSVHTDITYLNLLPDDRISFVGIHNEPSYYSLNTDPENMLKPKANLEISRREKEIIQQLAEGLSSKQIAGKLFISQHTVDTHRRHLLKKMGVKNTLELAVECLKRGLLYA